MASGEEFLHGVQAFGVGQRGPVERVAEGSMSHGACEATVWAGPRQACRRRQDSAGYGRSAALRRAALTLAEPQAPVVVA